MNIPLKGDQMKSLTARSITAAALVATLGVGVPAAAFASSTNSTTHSSTTSKATAVDVLAWKNWHATWMTYIYKMRSINLNYRTATESARAAFTTSMKSAKSMVDRTTARSNLNLGLFAAVNSRISAINAVGSPPAPPAGYNGTAYVTGIEKANTAFRSAIAASQTAYAEALLSATTPDQRSTARQARLLAVRTAVVARATALLALGSPPAMPGRKSA
jgi:hypothetical protein